MDQSRSQTQKISALHQEILALEKTNRRLSISHQLTQEFVGEVKGVKHLVSIVFDRVLEALDAQAGSLWLVDKPNRQNICHLAEGPAKKGVLGLRLPEKKGVVGSVIQSQQPVIVLDCSDDPRFAKDVDSRTGFVTRSMICVPLVIDNESYGALQIVNKNNKLNGQFDDEDCKLVMQLAAGASLSLKNARILEMESRVDEMRILMEISKEIVSTLDLDQVLDYVVNKTNELVAINGGAIALYNEHKKQLELMVLSGGRSIDREDENQAMLVKLMAQVQKSERSAYVADLEKYKKTLDSGDNLWVTYMQDNQLKALWAMPLQDEEGVLGVVLFESDTPGFANGSKADLLHILSAQTTVALRNASLFRNVPLSVALSNASKKGRAMGISGWKKTSVIMLVLFSLLAGLHFLPVFRWVSGPAIVEARLGQGVFLPLAGKIDKIHVLEGQVVSEGDMIAQLNSSEIQLQLLDAGSQLAIIERQIVEARAESDAAAMNRAAIERQSLRAKVIKARSDLQHISLKAPIDGIVLTPNPKELEGRVFAMGDEIVRLVDPKKLIILVHIPETDLLDIAIGQRVRCVLRAQPGHSFEGKVRHVGRSYEIPSTVLDSSSALEDEETQTGFIAEVEILNSPFEIRPGMTGHALIYTDKTSVIVRIWRRISNFLSFNLGL
jgi:transcriptional regulator with GAF, ATPase, and Fis domain/multidrug efflux pump subunit AcrA (membrane-fusion protein)|tara:strand:- start:1483 stop:3483 length:2001 start_codon:yes stop_codon:yes gene_type:complete